MVSVTADLDIEVARLVAKRDLIKEIFTNPSVHGALSAELEGSYVAELIQLAEQLEVKLETYRRYATELQHTIDVLAQQHHDEQVSRNNADSVFESNLKSLRTLTGSVLKSEETIYNPITGNYL